MDFWIYLALPNALSAFIGGFASRFTINKFFKDYANNIYHKKSLNQFSKEEKKVFILQMILFLSYGLNLLIFFSWLMRKII